MSKFADTASHRLYKLMRQLEKHKERYIRAWMLAYGADPRDVVLVTRPWSGGEASSFRVEFAKTADPVVELVKAARAVIDEDCGLYSADALANALEHFKDMR